MELSDHPHPDDPSEDLPTDPAALIALLEEVDPAEAPDLVARITAALEAALSAADE